MDIEELFPNTQLALTPPETGTEPGEEEEPSPYVGKYDRAYETVVPTCFYDLKKVESIMGDGLFNKQ